MAYSISLWYACVIYSVCVVSVVSNSTEAVSDKNEAAVIVRECRTPNHDTGFCIRIKQCNILLSQVNNTDAREFLLASRCGSPKEDISNPKVCCGKYDNFRRVKMNRIFPRSCGHQEVAFESRIMGGKEASLGEFPWIARLMYRNKDGQKVFGCSGFLLNYNHVITAAHCVHPGNVVDKVLTSVVLGEHNTETKLDCSSDGKNCNTRHIRKIDKITIHPGYSPRSSAYYSDIAILHMKSGARRSKYVQPICVLRNSSEIPAKYFLSGWGKTEKALVSKIKMKVEVPPFDLAKCKKKFATANIDVKDTQICAGGVSGKDSCVGDSGGPLMMADDNETWYVAGVVSFGMSRCAMEGFPGIYTNITPFLPWIKSEIEQNLLSLNVTQSHKKPKPTVSPST
ncbi:melanization protease 1 [Anoplophora glabripennis]|uniref:melanization protease 1 n=1 Tax=Anoplophora glabripennis TaxID=217634 RepID=UPI0008756C9E|nr:melanization protease 1 [Anoplophora glabripennis]